VRFEDVAGAANDPAADYLFHFAYTDSSVTGSEAGNTLWSATDGLVANNTYMLSNAIQATVAQDKKLKCVMLQTGTKNCALPSTPRDTELIA
jgi:hypothetical protein